jgi:hypothetical protein
MLTLLIVALAQSPGVGLLPAEYQSRYAPIAEVTAADAIGGGYVGKGVKVRGWLDDPVTLSDGPVHIHLAPVDAIAPNFAADTRAFVGQPVEVTGVFRDDESGSPDAYSILVWKYDGPGEKRVKATRNLPQSLLPLVANPGRHDGETVRVVGQFRGRNLDTDLPPQSESSPTDWVLKNGLYAVWVTGREPKGSGWDLDPTSAIDTKRWLEVTGRVTTKNGVTYLQASKLDLVAVPRGPHP